MSRNVLKKKNCRSFFRYARNIFDLKKIAKYDTRMRILVILRKFGHRYNVPAVLDFVHLFSFYILEFFMGSWCYTVTHLNGLFSRALPHTLSREN